MSILGVFVIKKEERILAFAMLLVFLAFNVLLISSHFGVYTMGAHGGFWSLFTKNFRMSGYDNWSWITISSMRVHFETIRHPLFLTNSLSSLLAQSLANKYSRHQFRCISYGDNHTFFGVLFCCFHLSHIA